MTMNSIGSNGFGAIASKHNDAVSKALEQIATAKKASMDDASSLSISNMLQSQISGLDAGVMNGNQAIGMLQIADGALSSLSQGSDELSKLSVAYNNGALNSDQRNALVGQANDIKSSMQQVVDSATMNGQSVFGTKSFDLGSSVQEVSATLPSISSLDITNQDSLNIFSKNLSSSRSEIGSSINGIVSTVSSNITTSSALQSARSQINDADMAKMVNEKSKSEIQMNAAIMAQSHSTEYLQKMSASLLR